MFRLAKMTDYAALLMAELAAGDAGPMPVGRLAESVRAPEPTVAKIMKQLVQAKLVRSVRGASGGYCLCGSSEDISLADVVEAMEGPVALTECGSGSPRSCVLEDPCTLCGVWAEMGRQIRAIMASVSLADLVRARKRHAAD
ncbi:MAG TPA: SUF system Fe-S cluster assembly regulator [Rhodospirillaceae bacterium]|nr:MAG: SUF system Fe-S cluster assembly regulator [Alphaproteobacteria bacterium GWF2_58_20]HAU29136.1 SUF system Fe-S cluster assembly regulator [Rhodospirillaceae bacterium]